jgi:hypothetical protein
VAGEILVLTEVDRARSGRGLHLDAGDRVRAALQDHVHLHAILVAEVMKADLTLAPARLPAQLLGDEGLEQLAQRGPVPGGGAGEGGRVAPGRDPFRQPAGVRTTSSAQSQKRRLRISLELNDGSVSRL